MKKVSYLAIAASLVFLASCGKNDTLDKQSKQRDSLSPELQGTWRSSCENSATYRIVIEGEKVTYEKQQFLDAECTLKNRTIRHSGDLKLANNYKEGINNTIVFVPSNEVGVTFHTEEADLQNNNLTRIKNDDKETPTKSEMTTAQKATIKRNNDKVNAAKQLTAFTRDQEKVLNRLQLEKLNDEKLNPLNVQPFGEQGSRVAVKYEVDNGFLQVTGPSDFGRVYAKQ